MAGFRSLLLNLILSLNGLIASLFSLFVIAYCVFPEILGKVQGDRLDIPLVSGRWKAICLLVALLIVIWNLTRLVKALRGSSSRDAYIQSKAPQGEGPGVSLRALENSLIKMAKDLPEIKKVFLQVRKGGDKEIKIEVRYVTYEGLNVIKVSEKLRSALAARFNEIVQLQEDCRLDFDIRLDRLSPGKMKREKREESPKEEETFTGPKFPVD